MKAIPKVISELFCTFLILSFSCVLVAQTLAQEQQLFRDPKHGEVVFKEKSCQKCHAIRGEGGTVAKDLGWNQYYGSALDLAADLWNHSPEMREVMDDLQVERPVFTEEELTILVAYLYYQRFLKETGDVLNGKRLLSSKGCLNCHGLGDAGGTIAPRLDRLPEYVSPLFMAESMWNHGPEMQQRMRELNMEWPKFENEEIVDLTNYMRILRKDSYARKIGYEPGDPAKGKELLQHKGCLDCHAIRGEGDDTAPDFSELSFDKSVTEVAGLMWNHGSEMIAMMQEKRINWPQFERNELADVISFFYYLNLVQQKGDSSRGELVFKEKGCISCHSDDVTASGPDLTELGQISSPFQMAQMMWNHAPKMEMKMTEANLEWPQFDEDEMDHLFMFLSKGTLNARK